MNTERQDPARNVVMQIEEQITQLDQAEHIADTTFIAIRRLTQIAIKEFFGTDEIGQSLNDAIHYCAQTRNHKAQRQIALLLVRLLGVQGLLHLGRETERHVVDVFEQGLQDLAKQFGLERKRQTFEKFELIGSLHEKACMLMSGLAQCPSAPERLVAGQADLLKILNSPFLSAYLQPYGFGRVKEHVVLLPNKIRDVLSLRDHSYSARLIEVSELVQKELKYAIGCCDFLTINYYLPFLSAVERAVNEIQAGSRERFICDIVPLKAVPDLAEKHYPLHAVDRAVKVVVRMVNKGPGVALDAIAEISGKSGRLVYDDKCFLGDIPPGPFTLAFEILILEPTLREDLVIDISWLEVGAPQRKEVMFDCHLKGQRPDIDWAELEMQQPYSTEVAEGEDFVGRRTKLNNIAARYLKARMVSSFITGQKRVGKTSLARAVEGYLKGSPKGADFQILYLEYGQYSRMKAVDTVEALGLEIAEFMCTPLQEKPQALAMNFSGSLAPLSKLADALIKECPGKRFVIILDEFDEIHLEIYRFGPLAETLFSNLRALSAKKNLAFLLVGGEKMPFVMSAQGDQLNKFVKEQVDYFNRVDEWEDYVELVRRPVQSSLDWTDGAVARLFELTHGHPYYTKLLCNAAYTTAVSARDSVITQEEVDSAAYRLIKDLGSNVFAHIWKDGIQQEGADAEVVEVRRRRVLSAMAQVLRAQKPLTIEHIVKYKSGLKLQDSEVPPLLNDLARRQFIYLERGEYQFSIPLFQLWLIEHGAAQLMSDALAEEYELSVEKAEEEAYISLGAIVSLVKKWHIYRGQVISPDVVRAWLNQAPTRQEQRLLFKMLENLRFVSTAQIREMLKDAHNMLTQFLRPFVSQKRMDRRQDVLVTYVDGTNKSGGRYASLYAEENRIASRCVVEPNQIAERINAHESQSGESISAIVLVDDFIGTGRSLSGNIIAFVETNKRLFHERAMRLFVVVLAATKVGEEGVRKELRKLPIKDCDLRVCEIIAEQHVAFSKDAHIWSSEEEAQRAKALCQRYGRLVHKENPLGYGDQGLLLVFPDNCPNNALPILHSDEQRDGGWVSLFPRSKT